MEERVLEGRFLEAGVWKRKEQKNYWIGVEYFKVGEKKKKIRAFMRFPHRLLIC